MSAAGGCYTVGLAALSSGPSFGSFGAAALSPSVAYDVARSAQSVASASLLPDPQAAGGKVCSVAFSFAWAARAALLAVEVVVVVVVVSGSMAAKALDNAIDDLMSLVPALV